MIFFPPSPESDSGIFFFPSLSQCYEFQVDCTVQKDRILEPTRLEVETLALYLSTCVTVSMLFSVSEFS